MLRLTWSYSAFGFGIPRTFSPPLKRHRYGIRLCSIRSRWSSGTLSIIWCPLPALHCWHQERCPLFLSPAGFARKRVSSDGGKLWDPVWFAIHEAVAMLVWLVLGMVTDAAGPSFQRVMWTYLASRATFGVFTALDEAVRLGILIQTFFWLGLVLFGIGYLVIQGVARISATQTRH